MNITYESKLATFGKWDGSWRFTKEQLAEAGCSYTIINDHVICYCCGTSVKGWRSLEEPWIEHAKMNCSCFFVKCIKGKEFIDELQKKYSREIVGDESCSCSGRDCVKREKVE